MQTSQIYNLFTLFCASLFLATDARKEIALHNCPAIDKLTFFPLNPNPIVVYGNWKGQNEQGVEFKSYRAPDGMTHTTGRRGELVSLNHAYLVEESNIIQCMYSLTTSDLQHMNQLLISTKPVNDVMPELVSVDDQPCNK